MPEKAPTEAIHTTCATGERCQLDSAFAELKQAFNALSELVSTDTLTGLHNYRYFTQAMAQEIERSQRTGQPTTLIMLDADHFKQVNDKWGHEAGNQALQLIARCVTDNVRKLDIACRYGGEEFAIILPSTDLLISQQVAERIRLAVEQALLTYQQDEIKLTISLGLSSYWPNKNQADWHQLVEDADKQLYRAKQQGRNQSCYAEGEHLEQQVSEDEKSALFDIFKE